MSERVCRHGQCLLCEQKNSKGRMGLLECCPHSPVSRTPFLPLKNKCSVGECDNKREHSDSVRLASARERVAERATRFFYFTLLLGRWSCFSSPRRFGNVTQLLLEKGEYEQYSSSEVKQSRMLRTRGVK